MTKHNGLFILHSFAFYQAKEIMENSTLAKILNHL